jgi:hypothetical protein
MSGQYIRNGRRIKIKIALFITVGLIAVALYLQLRSLNN